MTYHISKKLSGITFDDAVTKVTGALQAEGFGVLTDIDVKATMKKKLDVDIRAYRILGACNPHLAYEALKAEDKIGTMLPCNVIVQETEDGGVEVAAVDPIASMTAVKNPALADLAGTVRDRLTHVIDVL